MALLPIDQFGDANCHTKAPRLFAHDPYVWLPPSVARVGHATSWGESQVVATWSHGSKR